MKKTRKAAAVLTAVAMAAVSAAPVMADEIKADISELTSSQCVQC